MSQLFNAIRLTPDLQVLCRGRWIETMSFASQATVSNQSQTQTKVKLVDSRFPPSETVPRCSVKTIGPQAHTVLPTLSDQLEANEEYDLICVTIEHNPVLLSEGHSIHT